MRFDIDGWWDITDFTKPSGCSIPDAVCTPEQARSELIEPPYNFDFGVPLINTILINKIYSNKKGKDMSDDELNMYLKDLNRYSLSNKCNLVMGEGCGNSSGGQDDQTVSYTRWKNAMDNIGAICPGKRSRFDPKCTTGCYALPSNDVLNSIPFARLFDSGYCLDP